MSDKETAPWKAAKQIVEQLEVDETMNDEVREYTTNWIHAIIAVECTAPAPQPAEGCSECHPMHNAICLCKCHDDGTSSTLQPDLELLRRELRSKEDALIAMEKAAADMLLHDGGEGSLNYDARAYRESRRHLQSLANISCDKCGETLPHLYDENCTEQASPVSFVSEISYPGPSCTFCGAAMVLKCLSCGSTSELTEQASPTPESCPNCSSDAKSIERWPCAKRYGGKADPWHSSASTPKGTK